RPGLLQAQRLHHAALVARRNPEQRSREVRRADVEYPYAGGCCYRTNSRSQHSDQSGLEDWSQLAGNSLMARLKQFSPYIAEPLYDLSILGTTLGGVSYYPVPFGVRGMTT